MAEAKGPLTEPAYIAALKRNQRLSRQEGIDAVMTARQLDALLMPTTNPPTKFDLVNGSGSLSNLSGSSLLPALAGFPRSVFPPDLFVGYTPASPRRPAPSERRPCSNSPTHSSRPQRPQAPCVCPGASSTPCAAVTCGNATGEGPQRGDNGRGRFAARCVFARTTRADAG